MKLTDARGIFTTVMDVVNARLKLPWLVHVALVLAALPILVWVTGNQSSYETLHAVYAGPISMLLPIFKAAFDYLHLDRYPYSPTFMQVVRYQRVYRPWWLVVQVAATTVAYLSVLDIIP